MWSRLYNDPLVVVRDDIPPDCQIEDGGIDATSRGSRGSRGSRVSSTTTGTNATGDNSCSQQNQALITEINKIAGTDELATKNERTAVATIKETMELVDKCESDIKKYKSDRNNKRKRHQNNPTKMESINKKYKEKIDYQKTIIKSLKKSIVTQTKKLDAITAENKKDDCSDESRSISSNSSSDDDNSINAGVNISVNVNDNNDDNDTDDNE